MNIPPKYSASGKRERHYFPTRDKAKEAASKLKERQEKFGINQTAITPTLADHATQAEALLASFGISVLEAAKRIAEMEKKAAESVPIETALEAFMLRKDDLEGSSTAAYKTLIKNLQEDFPGRIIASITGQELNAHLDNRTGGPASYNQRIRLLGAIWRWCARLPRRWTTLNAIEHFEPKDFKSGNIEVLLAKDAENLMRTAEKYLPECVPAFAMKLYTGIRNAELQRLTPSDVTDAGITIPAKIARKTNRRRYVQMSPPLKAWLKAYPVGESVLPANWRRKEIAVRRLAGYRVWSSHVTWMKLDPPMTAAAPANLPEWPHNALRHTAASVALALKKRIEELVFEHGHTGGLETLRAHYIGLMPKHEAQAIWALRPQAVNTK